MAEVSSHLFLSPTYSHSYFHCLFTYLLCLNRYFLLSSFMVSMRDVFAPFWVALAALRACGQFLTAPLLYVMFKKEIKMSVEKENIPGTVISSHAVKDKTCLTYDCFVVCTACKQPGCKSKRNKLCPQYIRPGRCYTNVLVSWYMATKEIIL